MARMKSAKAARTDARSKAQRARKRTGAARRTSPPPAITLTHRELTDRYNALVPRALALGITAVANSKVRIHTSDFFTKELGVRIIAALEAAIAAAQALLGAGAAPRPLRSWTGRVFVRTLAPGPARAASHLGVGEQCARCAESGWRQRLRRYRFSFFENQQPGLRLCRAS
jgi:hypothetical protein